MTTNAADRLVHEVGGLMLSDPEYVSNPWDAISIVGTISGGQQSMTGYRYLADGSFHPSLPDDDGFGIMDALARLQTEMAAEAGAEWHQCLIQIWKPGPKIHIDFEYDDPQRWKPRITGLDMSEYANSIRPPMGGATDGT